jgi:hypothetical protein
VDLVKNVYFGEYRKNVHFIIGLREKETLVKGNKRPYRFAIVDGWLWG